MAKRIGLIDGDVVAYRCAAAVEREHRWDDGVWTYSADEAEGERTFNEMMDRLIEKAKLDEVIVAFTDCDNWRKQVLPSYKSNRQDIRKPLILKYLKENSKDYYKSYQRPGLEADDCLGILATMKPVKDEQRVICSIDKDFKSIPGEFYDFGKDVTHHVTQHQADYWHMLQTLMGDASDGYTGCPGVGIKTAEKILNEALEEGTPWANPQELNTLYWKHVIKAYEKAKFGEEYALTQARVARICRAEDYDFKKKEVKLWVPPKSLT